MILAPGLVSRPRAAHDAVAERVHRAPQIVHLDREDDIGLADHRRRRKL